jgi:hypothetical protein
MKLAEQDLNNIRYISIIKKKPSTVKSIFNLVINLAGLYLANELSINVWRSLTGH